MHDSTESGFGFPPVHTRMQLARSGGLRWLAVENRSRSGHEAISSRGRHGTAPRWLATTDVQHRFGIFDFLGMDILSLRQIVKKSRVEPGDRCAQRHNSRLRLILYGFILGSFCQTERFNNKYTFESVTFSDGMVGVIEAASKQVDHSMFTTCACYSDHYADYLAGYQSDSFASTNAPEFDHSS